MLGQYQGQNLFKTKTSSDILPGVSTDTAEYYFDIVEGVNAQSCFVSLDFGNTGNSEVIEVHRTAMDGTRLYYYQYNREFPDRTHEVNSFCQINSVAQYVNTIMNNIDTFGRTRKMINPGLKVRVYGGIVEDLGNQNIVVADQTMDMIAGGNYIYYDHVNNNFAKSNTISTEFDVVSKVTVVGTDITEIEDLRAIKVRLKNGTVLSKLSEVLGKLQYNGSDVGTQGIPGQAGKGIVNIKKTSTVGNIDTYTITYTDETTDSFEINNCGFGDMLKLTYDPNNKNGDAFDMENMVEGATKKILTSAERIAWNAKQSALGFTPEDITNRENIVIDTSTTKYPTINLLKYVWDNAKEYADSLVIGLLNDRGNYDASVNTFPTTGGSGTAGAIKKGNLWIISVGGTLGGQAVTAGDTIRALVTTPGQTPSNWAIAETNIGYVTENQANKATTMTGNTASNTIYLTAKAIYDWVSATFASVVSPIFSGLLTVGNNTSGGNIQTYATLGAELFTSFLRTNWTLTSGWDSTNSSDTQLNKNAAGVTTATLNTLAPTIGKIYKIIITVGDVTGGNFQVSWGGYSSGVLSAATTYILYTYANTTAGLLFTPSASGMTGTITDISIKELVDGTGQALIENDLKLGGEILKPDGMQLIRFNGQGQAVFATTINGLSGLSIIGPLYGATTIASSGANTNTQAGAGTLETRESFISDNSSAATANTPVQNSTRSRWSGRAWDTASRFIDWVQGVTINAQANIATRMKWAFQIASGGYSELMNIENNGALNVLGVTLGTECLTNGALTSGTSWSATGDFVFVTNRATYTHSTGAGSIIQSAGTLATPLVGSRWYKFTFTTSSNSGTTNPTLYIPNTVALNTTQISEGTNNTYSIYFKTIANPTDFIVSGLSGVTGAVTIDSLSLKEVSGGTIMVDNVAAKNISGASIQKRCVATTQSATPAINTNNGDIFQITGLAQAITSMTTNLTGTPVNGQMIMIDITDNGTAKAIAWGLSFESSTAILPLTTVASTLLKVILQWNTATSKWRCVGVV